MIRDSTCPVNADGTTYPNWVALVAANPTWHISNWDWTFIISDSGTPQYTVFDAQILTNSRGK